MNTFAFYEGARPVVLMCMQQPRVPQRNAHSCRGCKTNRVSGELASGEGPDKKHADPRTPTRWLVVGRSVVHGVPRGCCKRVQKPTDTHMQAVLPHETAPPTTKLPRRLWLSLNSVHLREENTAADVVSPPSRDTTLLA